jgi:Telomere resolvase
MRKWLQALVDEYLPAIAGLQQTEADRAQAIVWATWMRERWADHGLADLRQQRNLMTDVRRVIKTQLGTDHVALEAMNFTMAEWLTINEPIGEQVARRNENVVLLENPDAIVALAVRLLASREWSEIAAGLVVLTGRRSSEILGSAEFLPKSQWSVWFTGALKRRGEVQRLSFEVPTLATAERVITALGKLRSVCPTQGLTAELINRKHSQAVASACDRHFSDLVPKRDGRDNLFTHLFRSVYAAIATFWYAPPTVDATEYKAAIQGHYAILETTDSSLRRSIAASRHYNDYKIADLKGNIDGRQGIKLGYGGVEVIDAFNPKLRAERKEKGMPKVIVDEQEISQQAIDSVALELGALPIAVNTEEKQTVTSSRKRTAKRIRQVSVDVELLKSAASRLGVQVRTGKGQGYELVLLELLLLLEHKPMALEPIAAQPSIASQTVADQAKTLAWLTGRVEQLEALLAQAQLEKTAALSSPQQPEAEPEREQLQQENQRLEAELQQTRSRLEGIQKFLSEENKLPAAAREVSPASLPDQNTTENLARAIVNPPLTSPHDLDPNALRALQAILDFNDNTATSHGDRWAISIPVMKDLLKQVGKATQPKIEAALRANSDVIQQHHQKHGLGERHNRVHQGHSISEVISLL